MASHIHAYTFNNRTCWYVGFSSVAILNIFLIKDEKLNGTQIQVSCILILSDGLGFSSERFLTFLDSSHPSIIFLNLAAAISKCSKKLTNDKFINGH